MCLFDPFLLINFYLYLNAFVVGSISLGLNFSSNLAVSALYLEYLYLCILSDYCIVVANSVIFYFYPFFFHFLTSSLLLV